MVDENRSSSGDPPPALSAAERDGPPPGGLQHAHVHYEHSDVSFRWIFVILLGVMVMAVITFYAVLRFFYDYRDYEAAIHQSSFPLAPATPGLPPQPRLEQLNRMTKVEESNVYIRQQHKEEQLRSYGPAEKGYVHVPIDRAIDFLANKLPVRAKQPTADQKRRADGLVDAGESNSGRVFRGTDHE